MSDRRDFLKKGRDRRSEIFAETWHEKIVIPLGHYNIPQKEYLVTAALHHYDRDDESIFAVMATDYGKQNSDWFTYHLTDEDLHDLPNRFKVKTEKVR